MLSLRIAVRFLKKSPVQTSLIVVGIAVGIAVVIFIGSLILSLQEFLIEQTLGSSPQLTITSSTESTPIKYSGKLKSLVEDDNRISAVLPMRTVSIIYNEGSKSTPLSIKSGKQDGLNAVYKLSDRLDKGKYTLAADEFLIGKELADAFDVLVGNRIDVTLPDGGKSELKVVGIFDLGARELNDGIAFAGPEFGEKALGLRSDKYSSIELQLGDVFDSTKVAKRIRRSVNDIKVADWQETRADLLSALSAQTNSTVMIQVFVVIAVALGIASTLSISAIQKTKQIGILKALGMSDGRSGAIFLWEGVMLGLLGTTGGLGLGMLLIRLFQYISAGAETELFPIQAQATVIILAVVIGVAVAMASAVLPSRRTSRLDPIDVIQSG